MVSLLWLSFFFCSSFPRRRESRAFSLVLRAKLPLLRAGNFFAGAKKSPRNTFLRVRCVFAQDGIHAAGANGAHPVRPCG